ncbi:MAG: serine/threonine-protein phosphatase [Deltaproteobacteria bacterium]|nr:serine/threonine-protein phosphatase [Deltaproteobacteria bacterium]
MQNEDNVHFQVEKSDVVASGISDPGQKRSRNEDSIWIHESGRVLLLADGMGGHERGEEASDTAIRVFRERLDPEAIREELEDITALIGVPTEIAGLFPLVDATVEEAASVLYQRNKELDLELYMGTTVVGLVLVKDEHVLWFHVGDSRLYRFRASTLERLTTDHSVHAEWIMSGRKGPEPEKNIITRAIGPSPVVQADSGWDKREKGDIFVLCSDGLTDMINDERIKDVLNAGDSVEDIANRLIDAANDAGGKDNVSVIVCRI